MRALLSSGQVRGGAGPVGWLSRPTDGSPCGICGRNRGVRCRQVAAAGGNLGVTDTYRGVGRGGQHGGRPVQRTRPCSAWHVPTSNLSKGPGVEDDWFGALVLPLRLRATENGFDTVGRPAEDDRYYAFKKQPLSQRVGGEVQ